MRALSLSAAIIGLFLAGATPVSSLDTRAPAAMACRAPEGGAISLIGSGPGSVSGIALISPGHCTG